jgi:hypothetical protein
MRKPQLCDAGLSPSAYSQRLTPTAQLLESNSAI